MTEVCVCVYLPTLHFKHSSISDHIVYVILAFDSLIVRVLQMFYARLLLNDVFVQINICFQLQ